MNFHGCGTFPEYCTSSRHDDVGICMGNMMTYYGRRGTYACPSCFSVYKGEFKVFVAQHKTHLGQFHAATKTEILRRTVAIPPSTVIPPTSTVIPPPSPPHISPPLHYNENNSFPSTSTALSPHKRKINVRFTISPPETCTPAGERVDLDKEEEQRQNSRSPSYDPSPNRPIIESSDSEDNIRKELTEALNIISEQFKAYEEQSQKERHGLAAHLKREIKEKRKLEETLVSVLRQQEEMKSLISSLLCTQQKEKEEKEKRRNEKEKRRKEREDKEEKRRIEKEEKKEKRRQKKEDDELEKEHEQEQKERELERRRTTNLKKQLLEAIVEFKNNEEDRKRQLERDADDSRHHHKKRKH